MSSASLSADCLSINQQPKLTVSFKSFDLENQTINTFIKEFRCSDRYQNKIKSGVSNIPRQTMIFFHTYSNMKNCKKQILYFETK